MRLTAWLLCVTAAAMLGVGASSASASDHNPFLWKGMVSMFATDFSETEAQCRALAAANSDDWLTQSLADKLCPQLQQQLQAGQCRPVSIDMRGIQHALLAQRVTGTKEIIARENAVVDLSFRPDALECQLDIDKHTVFVATVYVGTQPNGKQACYNLAADSVPLLALKPEEEYLPITIGDASVSQQTYIPRKSLPLGYCVDPNVRGLMYRLRD